MRLPNRQADAVLAVQLVAAEARHNNARGPREKMRRLTQIEGPGFRALEEKRKVKTKGDERRLERVKSALGSNVKVCSEP